MNRRYQVDFSGENLSQEAFAALAAAPDKADFLTKAVEFYVRTNLTAQLEEILAAVKQLDQKVSASTYKPIAGEPASYSTAKTAAEEIGANRTEADEEDLADLLLEGFDNF